MFLLAGRFVKWALERNQLLADKHVNTFCLILAALSLWFKSKWVGVEKKKSSSYH